MRAITLTLSILVLLPCVSAAVEASTWRSTVTLPDDPTGLSALDAFVIAEQLGDADAVARALSRDDWAEHLREWSAARWAARRGDVTEAEEGFDHAAATWPAGAEEPELVLALFDQQRLELALVRGDLERADLVAHAPLRPHHDAVWRALRARVESLRADHEGAAESMARAWEQADAVERTHPVFLHAAPAYLAVGDSAQAVQSWQDFVSSIRRPERLRAAVEVWEEQPALRDVVAAAEDPGPTLAFLARALRREESIEIVRGRLRAGIGDPAEQQLFIAEQLYRLRRHADLREWIDSTDRADWSDEQQARAVAYRWGMERRAGSSLEVARGFDAVAETWPDTPRAAEAWWEAAWMYELSDAPIEATDRYARHVASTTDGRFRGSAALRTILLPWRDGDFAAAAAALDERGPALGDGMDQAAAWWLLSQVPGAEGTWATRLRQEHPASPFWRGLAPRLDPAAVPGPAELASRQRDALARVAAELGTDDPLQDLPEDLTAIARVAALGLRTEATVRLDAWARENGRDDRARLQVVAVAWAYGLAEIQGRHGWYLERRLSGRTPELDAALRVIGLPTPYAGTVRTIASDLGLPPALVWALMRRESFFDADVVSLAGAYGLMQLLPTTADRVAEGAELEDPSENDLFVPGTNLRLGCTYLAGLRDEARGNWVRALASYNAGEANGERWEARLRPGEPPALGILVISYTETRSYVYNVLRVAHLYEDAWRAGS